MLHCVAFHVNSDAVMNIVVTFEHFISLCLIKFVNIISPELKFIIVLLTISLIHYEYNDI